MGCTALYPTLPAPTDQQLAREAFSQMERWMLSREAMSKPMHEVETEQLSQLRELGRLLLQAHLRARGPGDVGPQVSREAGDGGSSESLVFKKGRKRERKQETVFGGVTVERAIYALEGHKSVVPLDRELQLPGRSFSYPVQRIVVKQAVLGPFDESTATVREHTGAKVTKRSAEDIVRDAARDFEEFYAQSRSGDSDRPASEPIQVCAVDGKGVPMKKSELAARPARRKRGEKASKKRVATVAAVYAAEPRKRTPEEVTESLFRPLTAVPKPAVKHAKPSDKRVWASLTKGKDATLQEVRDEMNRRDSSRSKQWAGLSDGDPALQRRILKWMPGILLILDLFHVLEKLWKAAYLFHPEGSPEAVEWVRARTLRILRGQVSDVVRTLRQSATKRGFIGDKRKTIDEVTGYLYRNRGYMRYHEYLEQGLPIASGAVEGACKNLVKDRMERSGMRWSLLGAEAVLKMRAVYLSGDFEAYWAFHIAQDQRRLDAQAGEPLAVKK